MFYQQILLSKPLNKYVRCCWVLEGDRSDFREKKLKILPDGCPVFQENPTAFCQSNNRSLPQCFIYGQTTRYSETKAKAPFRNIGVYFRATALKSIFGVDAYEMTDRTININDLIKTGISDQLLNANSLSGQIKLLSEFLLKKADQRKSELCRRTYSKRKLVKKCSKSFQHIRTHVGACF